MKECREVCITLHILCIYSSFLKICSCPSRTSPTLYFLIVIHTYKDAFILISNEEGRISLYTQKMEKKKIEVYPKELRTEPPPIDGSWQNF